MPTRWSITRTLRPMSFDRIYRQRLGAVAEHYVATVNGDHGWGLTAGHPSSLVNTAEVLTVLRIARQVDVLEEHGVVNRALGFLAEKAPIYFQPRTHDGGRGEHTRFLVFTALGIATWPERSGDDHRVCLEWCIERLHAMSGPEGLPEERGVQDVSLFENALACDVMARVVERRLVSNQGLALARDLITRCMKGICYNTLANGTWPRQTYQNRTSVAKTSRVVIALCRARQARALAGHYDVGGATSASEVRIRSVDDLIQTAVTWLCNNVNSWRGNSEIDSDVAGTIWSHLSHPLACEAAAIAGRATDEALAGAWEDLRASWGAEPPGWREGHPPDRLLTVRSNYNAFCAFDAVRTTDGDRGLTRIGALAARDRPTSPTYRLVVRAPMVIELCSDMDLQLIDLTESQAVTLRALVGAGAANSGVTTRQLAARLGVEENAVGQRVSRLNKRVQTAIPGFTLARARPGSGYRLQVTSVDHAEVS